MLGMTVTGRHSAPEPITPPSAMMHWPQTKLPAF
jgi:hypothetical protein